MFSTLTRSSGKEATNVTACTLLKKINWSSSDQIRKTKQNTTLCIKIVITIPSTEQTTSIEQTCLW